MPTYTGSKAYAATGAILNINTGTASAPTLVPVDEIISPKQSGAKNNFAETTNLQSTGEEFLATLPSSGNWNFTMNRLPGGTGAGQTALLASFNAFPATLMPYVIQLPKGGAQTTAGDTISFKAFVEECSLELDPKKQQLYTASLKVSGPITTTAGS